MPLLNFTQLTDKVLDHTKVHTIRLPRKRPFKLGDSLHTYVSIKAGMATLINIKSKKFADLNLEDALLDGFESLDDMNNCLKIMHPKIEEDSIVDLLTFEPHWDPQRIVKIKNQIVINNNPAIRQLKAMLLDWFHRCPGITEDQHVQAFDLLEKIEDEKMKFNVKHTNSEDYVTMKFNTLEELLTFVDSIDHPVIIKHLDMKKGFYRELEIYDTWRE